MSGNSVEVNSYQEGEWQVSVRSNPENDRMDEGDNPEGHFNAQRVPVESGDSATFNVYKDNILVAEVRGTDANTRTIIPMRELSPEEEDLFHRFLDEHLHKGQ
ncbi:hypothetical protein ACQCN2_17015 [Brevibacillus ginsengisoli]|uniref:hypothetical protein n=1 Tax=Brevibacillus ginsengisoli TaxID=363854 RepID=UPI003CED96A6